MTDLEWQSLEWHSVAGVGRLILKRPPLNVLNIAMLRELLAVLEIAAGQTTLRVLVLRAEGKLFSAGVDVADHTADKVSEMIPLFNRVCLALAEFPVPTLAVVHGHALGGGCELVLCCDLVLAAHPANFAQPEIKLATIAPVAALCLPTLVGYRRAAEILFTGETVSAGDAARIGLITSAVPADELDQAVDRYLVKLSGLSAAALRLAKKAVRLGGGWASLPAVEKLYLEELMTTADAVEGVESFMEKRAAVWSHQ